MNADTFRRMAVHGREYWWYNGKESMISQLTRTLEIPVNGRVLDLGCGTGTLFEFLKQWGRVFGLELSSEALLLAHSRNSVPLVQAAADAVPFKSHSFSVVALFDCLEHLPDDRLAMKQVLELLKPDGYVLITVPAFNALHSRRDIQLAHIRRYSPAQLRSLIVQSGFHIVQMTFGYLCLVLPLFIQSLIDRFRSVPRHFPSDIVNLRNPWNNLLSHWLAWEAWFAARWRLPIGTSIFCIAQASQLDSPSE